MNTCIKCVAAGFLGGALLLASKSAAAQGVPNSTSAQAEALVRQAHTLLDTGRVEAACTKFEAAEALVVGAHTLLELGDCYQRTGRSASAWHSFLEAEALAQNKQDHELAQRAAERVAALEPKLNRIVFVVPTTSRVPGLTVRLGANTVPSSAWGTAIPIDPGMQRVSASAKGYHAWSSTIDATTGEGRRYPIDVPTLAPEQVHADRARAYRTAGVVTGSVGLAGIGAGAVFSALSRTADAQNNCAKGVVQCTPSPASKSSLSDAATVSFAVGGALVATGVTLFVLAPSSDNKEQHALRVAARYASSGGRVQLEGVW
jgi:serine/threonine-protein kinase